MAEPCSGDDSFALLVAARPEPPAALVAPDSPPARSLLDRIVAQERPASSVGGRRRTVPVPAMAMAVVAVVAIVAAGLAVGGGRGSDGAAPAEVVLTSQDVRRIAEVSAATLNGSGRAEVTFRVDGGLPTEQSGTARLAFVGEDLDMVTRFDGTAGRPGFEAANRTADGHFYLLDGPPEARTWYRDENVDDARRSDLFSLDPRTLLAAVHPEGNFVHVGTDEVDGVRVRHLRATHPDRLPALNLSLGPIDPASVETLDVWADGDDLVRRLDLTTASRETRPAGLLKKVVGPDGRTRIELEAGSGTTTTEHRAAYSVRFYDIGAPLTITAPAGAVPVRGLG